MIIGDAHGSSAHLSAVDGTPLHSTARGNAARAVDGHPATRLQPLDHPIACFVDLCCSPLHASPKSAAAAAPCHGHHQPALNRHCRPLNGGRRRLSQQPALHSSPLSAPGADGSPPPRAACCQRSSVYSGAVLDSSLFIRELIKMLILQKCQPKSIWGLSFPAQLFNLFFLQS